MSRRVNEIAQTWHHAGRSWLSNLFHAPAAWLYATVYIVSMTYLIAIGQNVLDSVAFHVTMVVLVVLTLWITRGTQPLNAYPSQEVRLRVMAQVAVIMGVILVTGYTALGFHRVISPASAFVPVWTPVTVKLGELGLVFGGNWGMLLMGNPIKYFVLPLIVLLILGAHLRTLGFEQGYRVWRVTILWTGIEIGVWMFRIITGYLNPVTLGKRILSEALQNGFFEEFLFRGALQTRLTVWLGPGWALVLQSFAFGAWHLGLDASAMGGNLAAGLAYALFYHSVMGMVYGIVFMRTRNLLAGSIAHTLINSFA